MRIFKRLAELIHNRAELKRQFVWMLRRTRPFLGRMVLLFLLDVLISVIAVGTTVLNKGLIDGAVSEGGFNRTAFLLLLLLSVCSIAVSAGCSLISTILHERYGFAMRLELYDRMLHSHWLKLTGLHSGDVQTRLTGDIDTVAGGITGAIPDILSLLVRLVLAFVVLWRYDNMLAVAALVLGPVGALAGLLFAGSMHKCQVELRESESDYRSFMQESTENIVVTKAFSQEDAAVCRLAGLRDKRMQLVSRRALLGVLSRVTMNVVFNTGYLLAFGWGILQISRGEITYGTMSIFLSLVNQIQGPIFTLGNLVPRLVNVLASVGRVMQIDDLPHEEPMSVIELRGSVGARMTDVSFAYEASGDEQPAVQVLRHIDLEIHPGEAVALVGSTGSGKTTAARLLLNLIAPTEGQVVFYDEAGRTVQASPSTRQLIAYVPQGNTLSSGTIRENLVMSGQCTDEELESALQTAEALSFVQELENGLDTRIGEKGVGLSEGQAQRLAIARALLRKAPFLILDEASASLDMETEQKIMKNLKQRTCGITCLVITHRPSMLELCDRCCRVKDGQITAM